MTCIKPSVGGPDGAGVDDSSAMSSDCNNPAQPPQPPIPAPVTFRRLSAVLAVALAAGCGGGYRRDGVRLHNDHHDPAGVQRLRRQGGLSDQFTQRGWRELPPAQVRPPARPKRGFWDQILNQIENTARFRSLTRENAGPPRKNQTAKTGPVLPYLTPRVCFEPSGPSSRRQMPRGRRRRTGPLR